MMTETPMFLTNSDISGLIDWRHELHRHPELSGQEVETARRVVARLQALQPDKIITDLGGHGVAAIFSGAEPGPTVLLRAELDALPIHELSGAAHSSTIPGKGHLCGHDGHMATLMAVATGLSRQRPKRGRVVLLFQPAEEDGSGAAKVIADPQFAEIAPDLSFSLHNFPGIPLGTVALAAGPVNCASRGMRLVLKGKTAHASMPESGVSPMQAVAALMPALTELGHGTPQDDDFAMATVTHARMGEAAFGIAPGEAEIWATLRTLRDATMDALCARAEALAREAAARFQLGLEIAYADIFLNCENSPVAVERLARALDAENIRHDAGPLPMRGSEDFGRFGKHAPAAMFFLGAGERHPQLHNPDYDFPDALMEVGARVFMRVVREVMG